MLYDKRWEQKSIELEPWQRILLDAAEIIETHGWCQGAYRSNGAHCTVGAIGVASRSLAPHAWRPAAAKAARRVMHAVGTGIASWNDDPDRTAAEVCAKLREVARP